MTPDIKRLEHHHLQQFLRPMGEVAREHVAKDANRLFRMYHVEVTAIEGSKRRIGPAFRAHEVECPRIENALQRHNAAIGDAQALAMVEHIRQVEHFCACGQGNVDTDAQSRVRHAKRAWVRPFQHGLADEPVEVDLQANSSQIMAPPPGLNWACITAALPISN